MRGTRWLLLVAIVAIVYGIGFTYRTQKKALQNSAVAKPATLPPDLNSTASNYQHHVTDHGRVIADIEAEDFRQVKDSSHVDLKNVKLSIASKDGKSYNLVKSAAASFFTDDERLYSEGEVEMTLKVPRAGQPRHKLVSIKSSGVTFDTASGKAETDRASSFVFENGNGKATGAFYDPNTHQLIMKSDVEVDWKPLSPHAKLMKIEAGSLEYRESESEILLKPWGRLTRENTVVEGENPVIHLQDDGNGNKILRSIETTKAHGTDNYPNRKLQYAADRLWMSFDDDGQIQRMTAQGNANLTANSEVSETRMEADHVDMGFEAQETQSTLSTVDASGHAVVSERPLPAAGAQPGETHVLKSERIEMKMRPGGREIASVNARPPGQLEFLPNLPAQRHRTLDGQDIAIVYGPQNRMESFHAVNARTSTDPNAEEKKHNRVQSSTASREILARFDPKTRQMSGMEQSGDFTYEEGDRKARAAKASLDEGQNVIVLDSGARMADATGSTAADRIRMDQRTGNVTAEGNVNTSRLPDKDQKKNSQMLSGDQPLQAQARKMDSANRNRRIHYEGGVTLWQGANRIQADVVDLDRDRRGLVADGHVITNLWEQPKDDDAKAADSKVKPAAEARTAPAAAKTGAAPKALSGNNQSNLRQPLPDGRGSESVSEPRPSGSGSSETVPKKKSSAPVLTVVHAQHLDYTEDNRLAVYTGGVLLTRPGMTVKAKELRAFLADSEADSRLEKAFADGAVEIVQNSPGRKRTGTAEHSEYYTEDQRVILRGGAPKMVDTLKGDTTGDELTYFADNDRLLVNGKPAVSHMKQKKP